MFAEPYNGPRTCQLCKDDKGRRDSHICFFLFIPGISISVIFRVSKTIGQCGRLPGERERSPSCLMTSRPSSVAATGYAARPAAAPTVTCRALIS